MLIVVFFVLIVFCVLISCLWCFLPSCQQPEEQYAGCSFKNTTNRGSFGDALHEVDWIVGNLVNALAKNNLTENTLILFTGDNGPWMVKGKSGGSTGLLYGRESGYWNVGKGSTWEGGIHEAAFAHWPGTITSQTKSDEITSSLDLFPTMSALLGVPLPTNVVYDGKDMLPILLDTGTSEHNDGLFFYGGGGAVACKWTGPSAMRYGAYKAHFETGPGLSGCTGCKAKCYCIDPTNESDCDILLFNIQEDPSEAYPLTLPDIASEIVLRLQNELKTFVYGSKLIPPPDLPGEGPDKYGVCCDRENSCDCSGPLPPLPLDKINL